MPVHEAIKLGEGNLTSCFDNYRQSLRSLGADEVRTVWYNFMPVLDWARTQLRAPLPGGNALRYNAHEFAVFDCQMLQRSGAEADYPDNVLARARAWFDAATEIDKRTLLATIMAGLPGAFDRYDIEGLRRMLQRYCGIDRAGLPENHARVLRGKPSSPRRRRACAWRSTRTARHGLCWVCRASRRQPRTSPISWTPCGRCPTGLTLCIGSLGAKPSNDLPAIARRFADRIHFAHLRNVANEPDGLFMEADHLGGDTDMVAVVQALLQEQKRRRDAGDSAWRIPFRPDHGRELLDDVGKATHPGYPAIGWMRGLAELRGVMTVLALQHALPV